MFEKVNPAHVDKIADRIAGAIVDLAYKKQVNPKVACEVLIGHGKCYIINETDTHLTNKEILAIVNRIAGNKGFIVFYNEYKQDTHLANNQKEELKCGDNGIFKGAPITKEQKLLTVFVQRLYKMYPYDGKFIVHNKDSLIACQSNVNSYKVIREGYYKFSSILINPLGDWTGGTNVDSGATNRKLGSDMGDAITGGGLHGKDLSKADVSVNIFCHLLAQKEHKTVKAYCAIGDKVVKYEIAGKKYSCDFKTIVAIAYKYIKSIGGFEKLAEWGLIR